MEFKMSVDIVPCIEIRVESTYKVLFTALSWDK